MNRIASTILVASLAAVATTAPAQTRKDPLAAQAISRGEFVQAEQRLNAERRIYPHRPEVLLNLAAVYARTGRAAEARALYQDVLSREDIVMDLSTDRSASSHFIANTGLQALARPTNQIARY